MAGPNWNNLDMDLRVDRRPALRQYQTFTARSQLGFAVLRSDLKGERNDDDTRWPVPRSVQLARGLAAFHGPNGGADTSSPQSKNLL